MGATPFYAVSTEADLKTAFTTAREEAKYEYGHGGYTGSIAEKPSAVIISRQPVTQAEAVEMADQMINDGDLRIVDKWGPAGAIALSRGTREVTLTGLAADSTNQEVLIAAAKAELSRKRLIRRGEKVTRVDLQTYSTPVRALGWSRNPAGTVKITNAQVVVTIAKAKSTEKTVDGWLFFGWASE